jgi:hypothetical protein
MTRWTSLMVTVVVASCTSTGCFKSSPPAETHGTGSWIANGAGACDRYLGRDVVAAILKSPAGANKTLSPQACSYSTSDSGGTITITLTNAGPLAFDAYQKYLVNPQPLPGVGDKASQSMIGIVAVKGTDRNCSIDAGGAPDALRIRGAELGKKLGEICNQLFALP